MITPDQINDLPRYDMGGYGAVLRREDGEYARVRDVLELVSNYQKMEFDGIELAPPNVVSPAEYSLRQEPATDIDDGLYGAMATALKRCIEAMTIAPSLISNTWEEQSMRDHFAGVIAEAKEALGGVK